MGQNYHKQKLQSTRFHICFRIFINRILECLALTRLIIRLRMKELYVNLYV